MFHRMIRIRRFFFDGQQLAGGSRCSMVPGSAVLTATNQSQGIDVATLATTLAPGISRCTWMFVQAQIGKTFVWCHQVTFQTSLECSSHTLTTKISMAHGVPRGPVTLVTCASLFSVFFEGFN